MKEGEYRFPYWGALVIKTKIPKSLKNKLLKEGSKTKTDYRHQLAGMIDNEFAYEDYEEWFFPSFLFALQLYQDQWVNSWGGELNKIMTPFKIMSSELWINYQKSGEYNPRHNHDGDLSFVMYLKIPKQLKEENTKRQLTHHNEGTGTISFHYGERLPFSKYGHHELPEELDLFIFPSWLQHSVTPFFSDVERISVAGNIFLQRHE